MDWEVTLLLNYSYKRVINWYVEKNNHNFICMFETAKYFSNTVLDVINLFPFEIIIRNKSTLTSVKG
jgi:hypothetical protein